MDSKTLDVLNIVASDLPKSEVIGTLSKRVIEERTLRENYEYPLAGLFSQKLTFDGLKDFNYSELVENTTGSAYGDPTIDDFTAGDNKAIRDTFEAKTEHNYKAKIMDTVLMNFRTNPTDTVAAIFANAENIDKVQSKELEKVLWDKVNTEGYKISVAGKTDIEVNKEIYKFLLAAKTTSKIHPFIGTDGVISDKDGNTVQPAYKFDSSEFYMVSHPEFETNTVFDGERTFFNWNGSQLQLAGTMTIDFEKFEGVDPTVGQALSKNRAILIHKDAFETVADWEGSKLVNTSKLFNVIHNYMKWDVYKLKNKPVILFDATVVKGKKAE